jgi:hypothetical protein
VISAIVAPPAVNPQDAAPAAAVWVAAVVRAAVDAVDALAVEPDLNIPQHDFSR